MMIVSPQNKIFMNQNFIFKDFEVDILTKQLLLSLGNYNFLKFSFFSDSETLFKYKNWLM